MRKSVPGGRSGAFPVHLHAMLQNLVHLGVRPSELICEARSNKGRLNGESEEGEWTKHQHHSTLRPCIHVTKSGSCDELADALFQRSHNTSERLG